MNGIVVNEELMMDLTSEYAQKYNTIPETHKQAVQWAYEQGKAKAIDEFAERLKEVYPFTILELEQLEEIAEQLKGGAV